MWSEACRVAGVVAHGCGDGGDAGQAQCGDGEVAQRGHDLGCVAGADLGAVLVEEVVADPVQGFDAPVVAGPAGQQLWAGLERGQPR